MLAAALATAACSSENPQEVPPQAVAPKPALMEPTPETVATGGLIRGKAVIEMRNDQIRDLAGLELVLVPDDRAREITKVREERWRMRASRFNFDDGYNNLDINAIGSTAVELAVAQAKADQAGFYAFPNVPPGRYRIYAQYRSMYAVGYWLIPVEVKAVGDVVTVDINNDNFAEVYNYQQKR